MGNSGIAKSYLYLSLDYAIFKIGESMGFCLQFD